MDKWHDMCLVSRMIRENIVGLMAECKWRSEALDLSVLKELRRKADVFNRNRRKTYYYLFSRSGFTEAVHEEAERDESIVLVELKDLL